MGLDTIDKRTKEKFPQDVEKGSGKNPGLLRYNKHYYEVSHAKTFDESLYIAARHLHDTGHHPP